MKQLNLLDFTTDIPEQDYHNSPSMSYSDINRYYKEGFSCISTLDEHIESEALLEGSIIDTFLTEPENFSKIYYVNNAPKVSLLVQNVFNILMEKGYSDINDIPEDVIKEVSNSVNYRCTNKADTVKKYLLKDNRSFKVMVENRDKTIITMEQYDMAVKCKQAIYNNPLLRFAMYGNNDVSVYYQLKFFIDYQGIPYKFMPDVVHVDHNRKLVRIYDLKSTRHTAYDFPKSYVDYNYWMQQWLYTALMKDMLYNAGYDDYNVVWGGFIAVSKKDYTALLWTSDEVNKLIKGEGVSTEIPNPFDLGKEIFEYQQSQAIYPNWVNQHDINDVETYFKLNNIKL